MRQLIGTTSKKIKGTCFANLQGAFDRFYFHWRPHTSSGLQKVADAQGCELKEGSEPPSRNHIGEGQPILASMPARYWWDVEWRKQNHHAAFNLDQRPGASSNNAWWTGDGGQVAWFLYGYESLWMPASLLEDDSQERLAQALFAGSRHKDIELHFNKGLAGGPREAIEATRDTATNPAVLNAFALAIVGDAGGGYPGVRGHEPDVEAGRRSREEIHKCVNELRAIVPDDGAYVSESNFFQENWQQAYWGSNHARLASVKKKYDPTGLFFVHNGVGSEEWSEDGFVRKARS
ncbi:MAG: BBE domain-containing protein [Candidatus Sulfotelmatobacter sp.]